MKGKDAYTPIKVLPRWGKWTEVTLFSLKIERRKPHCSVTQIFFSFTVQDEAPSFGYDLDHLVAIWGTKDTFEEQYPLPGILAQCDKI